VRLVPDATVERGGCQLEADIARIDASMPTRWQRAVAQVGLASPWAAPDDAGAPSTELASQAEGPGAESAGALDRTPGRPLDRTPDPASGGASEAPAP
jgi:flagellar biosynthesis/type III secretory pathway protein FliH